MKRRQTALEHSASAVFDPLASDVISEMLGLLPPLAGGVDVVFDCAGIQPSLDAALKAVRPRGTIVNIAIWEKEAKLDMNLIMYKETVFTGKSVYIFIWIQAIHGYRPATLGYHQVHAEVIRLLSEGRFPGLEKYITRKIGLEDVVEKGIKSLLTEKDTQSKLVSPLKCLYA